MLRLRCDYVAQIVEQLPCDYIAITLRLCCDYVEKVSLITDYVAITVG